MSVWKGILNVINATVDTIGGYTKKIDDFTTTGLLGVNNSLAYRVHEIEKHFHNREKWFGAAVTPSGETHVADRMAGGVSPFTLTAGNDDFGAWVQILGSSDTPVQSGMAKFDAHRFLVTSTNSTSPFIVRVVGGESADIAEKIANEEFTEAPFISATNNNDSGISDIISSRIPVGIKAWERAACIGGNGNTLDFYIGIHEYVG